MKAIITQPSGWRVVIKPPKGATRDQLEKKAMKIKRKLNGSTTLKIEG
jgi:hypothetical protein